MPSYRPTLLLSLRPINFYSPSLSWHSINTGELRLPSYRPILLLSLRPINFYSPSLRWHSINTGGLRLPSYRPTLLLSLRLINFYSPSLRRHSVNTGGLRLPLFQTYTPSFALSLILINAVAIPPVFLRVFLKNTYSLRKIARYIQ